MKAAVTAAALSLGDLRGNPSPHLESPICNARSDPETYVPSPALSLHGSVKTKTNFIFSIPSFFHQPSEQAKFRPKISRERLSHPVYQRFIAPINISEERIAFSLPPVLTFTNMNHVLHIRLNTTRHLSQHFSCSSHSHPAFTIFAISEYYLSLVYLMLHIDRFFVLKNKCILRRIFALLLSMKNQ